MSAKNFSRIFFLFASALTALLGMLWLTLPAFLLNGWGIDAADAITLYLGQRMGALYLGLAVLFGMAARGGTGRMRSAILAGGAVGTGLMAVLSVMGALSGVVVGPAIWMAAVLEGIMAASFAYLLVRGRAHRAS